MFWTSSLSFFIKENWICAIHRHQAESNINILLTRNFPTDSGVRQWSHPLMIPLHCLWAKSNNRTRGHFECDVTWFFVLMSFVHMHGAVVVPYFVIEGGNVLDVDGHGGGESWKLDNFHGGHLCIVPNLYITLCINIFPGWVQSFQNFKKRGGKREFVFSRVAWPTSGLVTFETSNFLNFTICDQYDYWTLSILWFVV